LGDDVEVPLPDVDAFQLCVGVLMVVTVPIISAAQCLDQECSTFRLALSVAEYSEIVHLTYLLKA
jgi:hypothetical protein